MHIHINKKKRQDQQSPNNEGRFPLRLRGLHGLADIWISGCLSIIVCWFSLW